MRAFVNPQIRKAVIIRDNGCVYCGKAIACVTRDDAPYPRRWKAYDDQGNTFHFEHKVPLVAGGATDLSNIVLACRECNLEKARKERSKRAYEGGAAMGKAIKVGEPVYLELDTIRTKGQTFSQVIEELLACRLKLFETLNMIEGQLRYQEWRQKELQKALSK